MKIKIIKPRINICCFLDIVLEDDTGSHFIQVYVDEYKLNKIALSDIEKDRLFDLHYSVEELHEPVYCYYRWDSEIQVIGTKDQISPDLIKLLKNDTFDNIAKIEIANFLGFNAFTHQNFKNRIEKNEKNVYFNYNAIVKCKSIDNYDKALYKNDEDNIRQISQTSSDAELSYIVVNRGDDCLIGNSIVKSSTLKKILEEEMQENLIAFQLYIVLFNSIPSRRPQKNLSKFWKSEKNPFLLLSNYLLLTENKLPKSIYSFFNGIEYHDFIDFTWAKSVFQRLEATSSIIESFDLDNSIDEFQIEAHERRDSSTEENDTLKKIDEMAFTISKKII